MAVPVRLHLLLGKTYFQPGDAVSATIQVRQPLTELLLSNSCIQGSSTCLSLAPVPACTTCLPRIVYQIANDAALDGRGDTHIRELSFQATGTERTDPNWIAQLYRPEHPAEKDGSRVSYGERMQMIGKAGRLPACRMHASVGHALSPVFMNAITAHSPHDI